MCKVECWGSVVTLPEPTNNYTDDYFVTCPICDRKVEKLTRCDKCEVECCDKCLSEIGIGDELWEMCEECLFEHRIDQLIGFVAKDFTVTAKEEVSGYTNGNYWSGMELALTPVGSGVDMKITIKK